MTLEVEDFVSETVPEDDVKSPGADADPGAVAQPTWRRSTPSWRRCLIVNDAVVEPPVPSVTVTSEMVTDGVGAAAAGEGRERRSTAAAAAPAMRRTVRSNADGGVRERRHP